jgi:hypothetical protein
LAVLSSSIRRTGCGWCRCPRSSFRDLTLLQGAGRLAGHADSGGRAREDRVPEKQGNANLSGAVGTPTFDDSTAIWSNTTCPDNTNSDSNGNTCNGHFIPL